MDKRIYNESFVRVLCCMAGFSIATTTQAATCVVNSATDDPADASAKVTAVESGSWSGASAGVITLRDCIVAANLMTGATGAPTVPGMSITFDAGVFTGSGNSIIVLASDLPLVFNNTSVDASALQTPVTIDGGNALVPGQGFHAFFVSGLPDVVAAPPLPDSAQPVAVTLANLTIRNALAQGGSSYYGGGGMGAGSALFVNQLASVTLDHVGFATNTSAAGNSVFNGGGFGGGGMGASVVTGGGGGGMTRAQNIYDGGNGIGTASDDEGGGGFGGIGTGQVSDAQGFASPDFNGGIIGSDGGNGGGGGASIEEGYAGRGGFGGGGGRALRISFGGPGPYPGGNGGFGGGGGKAQGSMVLGGDGGFGGGGGNPKGHGGFGGGAAGSGVGGVGGGGNPIDRCAADYGFGGGAAFGGAIFVRSGGALTIRNGVAQTPVTIDGNDVIPSTGVNEGSNPGAAAGRGMFLMTGATTTFDIDGRYTISDNIADDSVTSLPGPCYMPGDGAGAALTKSGTGLLELSALDYRYTGATAINAGVLRLTGAIRSDSIIAAGAALAGNGFSAGVTNSGMIVPGTPADAYGTLTALGDVNLNDDSALCIHADATGANSQLSVSGSAIFGGGVRFEFAGTPPVGQTYTFITATSAAGPFAGLETSDPRVIGVLDYQFAAVPASVSFRVTANDAIFHNGFDAATNAALCAAAFAD